MPLQDICISFGRAFVIFLNASTAVSNMNHVLGLTKPVSQAHNLSPDMSWKQRLVLMEVIDSLYREQDREGARIAYLTCFGSTSWEEEELVVQAELAYADHVYSQTHKRLNSRF